MAPLEWEPPRPLDIGHSQVQVMEIDELMRLRKAWYSRSDVLWEIFKNQKYRETVFMRIRTPEKEYKPIRYMKCDSFQFLQRQMGFYHFLERPINLFSGLATVQNMPMIDYTGDWATQKQHISDDWNSYLAAFDLGFDIDAEGKHEPGFEPFNTYGEAKILKEVFDKFHVPYTIKISGSGFHFVIAWEFIPQEIKDHTKGNWESLIISLSTLCSEMKETLQLAHLDLGIVDLKRFWKTAYTIDCNNWTVCLPLTDEQFSSFDGKIYKLENFILNPLLITRRGMLTRPGDKTGLMNLAMNL